MPTSELRATKLGGWALLTMLLATALVALGGAAAVTAHRIEREREREAELLRAGAAIAGAIARYRDSPFATSPELPRTLADLLEDRRGPLPIRHLRRIPRDPITDRIEWGLVREGDRISGVYSLATRAPLRRTGFPAALASFEAAPSLRDWRFTAQPAEVPRANPSAPAAGAVAFPSRAK
jgi:hypothetical protein